LFDSNPKIQLILNMKKIPPPPTPCTIFKRDAAGNLVEVISEVLPQTKTSTAAHLGDYAAFSMRQAELGQPRGRFDY
jgi:hypothetical protein